MVTISMSGVAALERLGELKPGPAQVAATRAAKAARRLERWASFEASARDGLRYSRGCVGRLRKPQKDGGALSEWQMRRIIP